MTLQQLAALPEESRRLICRHFTEAARHRARQWDEERKIEALLGEEINVDFSDFAAGIDDPDDLSGSFDEDDVLAALASTR